MRFSEFNDEWEEKYISEAISIKSRKYNPENSDVNYRSIELESLAQDSGELLSTFDSKNQKSIKNVFNSGDVLFGKLRPYLKKYYLADFDGVCSSEIWVLKSSILDSNYLYAFVQSNSFISLTEILSGSKMPRADWNLVSSSLIVYPSNPDERKKIGKIIQLINSRIQTQKKIISQLKSQMSNLKDLLFAQQLRFKDENENNFPYWKDFRLSDLGNTFNGLSGKTKEHFGVGQKYIQYKQIFDSAKINIANCAFVDVEENENQNIVQYGDVFFTISSETPEEIGMSSVLLENVNNIYLNSFCFGFRTNSFEELIPEFSQFLFRTSKFRSEIVKLAQGSTRYNMSKIEFLKLKIKLPCKDEQIKIAQFLSSINEKINIESELLTQYENQKKYLLQNLFV
ncbi:type I restriction enzyme S subunit [Chryseobacterium sediminis]|uniref:Type I restriction enzyme S subunit n=1 Tax=Chryseobacterium sediminis TaxID=1679494 RepID=A0ABR6PZH2_9FLAO|nr:restriction endonuclease subunit S [Chryseobacterium sediminis]MBB6331117.1 type I restriction enzyme S subunit [Chryseobacterium sediminis]